MVGRLIIERDLFAQLPNLLAFPDAIIFLYGPVLYYSVACFFPRHRQEPLIRSIHFLPGFLFIIGEVGFRTVWLQHTLVAIIPVCGTFWCWGALAEGGAIAINAIFLAFSIRQIHVHERASANQGVMGGMRMATKMLLGFLGVVLFVWLLGFLSWTVWFASTLFVISYRSVWFLLVVGLYVFAFLMYVQQTQTSRKKASIPRMVSATPRPFMALRALLDRHVEEHKPYLDPKLNLQALAEQLNTTPHDLSRLLNEGYGLSYSDFVQQHRIGAFKRLVEEGRHRDITLLAMAYESGFNAKSTFYTAFRKATGMTPSAYVQASESRNKAGVD